ncbi:ABC transporter permease subunit [Pseudoduganella sp. FT26W]|uniref:ABC transporter permease subunit n=1 Tax=Duganella aquatilis TaxID=2666082 RepID=A0A844D7X1_9BURK|nr:ABC transporter permease subunit [Duganella aquatilis]MRW83339.1 ABC transporter permease subunit [Duganella aquatilis]
MKHHARWLGLPACLLLALPFATLIQQTPWRSFAIAPADLASARVSLGLGLVALLLIALLGTPLAFWLARTKSRTRGVVEMLVLASLLTPPLAMGILLVSAYGPYSALGKPLAAAGYLISNNIGAFILAQLYGGLAYYVMSARTAFESVSRSVEEAAETLGATPWHVFWLVTLPLSARGLLAGLALAWVRVIGEFGIVMIFAYFPQGMPVQLYINLQNDGLDSVYSLVWLLLLAALPLPLWLLSHRDKPSRH